MTTPGKVARAERLAAALEYVSLDYKVMTFYVIDGSKRPAKRKWLRVPCQAHPLKTNHLFTDDELDGCRECRGGVRAATSNPRYVEFLCRKAGRDAGIGIILPPNTIAIDDDSSVFTKAWDGLPRVRSQSGKSHRYWNLTPGQDGLSSCNGVVYDETILDDEGEPAGLVDIRVGGDMTYFLGAPRGPSGKYQPLNGWSPDPSTWDVLPDEVYSRLLEAPRRGSRGGGGDGGFGHVAGFPEARVGGAYDRDGDALAEMLDEAGWTELRDGEWMRPGGTQKSATLREGDDGIWFLNVFTPNAEPLREGCWYTATALRCLVEFGGNWPICFTTLLAEGAFDDDLFD